MVIIKTRFRLSDHFFAIALYEFPSLSRSTLPQVLRQCPGKSLGLKNPAVHHVSDSPLGEPMPQRPAGSFFQSVPICTDRITFIVRIFAAHIGLTVANPCQYRDNAYRKSCHATEKMFPANYPSILQRPGRGRLCLHLSATGAKADALCYGFIGQNISNRQPNIFLTHAAPRRPPVNS